MQHRAIRRTESHFAGARGQALFRRAWLPAQPERVLLLVHGLAEHSGRYQHVGTWFAARGWAVHAYDHRGHGRSGGARCHVRRFGELLDDLERVLGLVRDEHRDLPIHLVGHSMGGLVVAALVRERHPEVASAVTSAALLAISEKQSKAKVLAARLLRRVAPRLGLDVGVDPDDLSRDPEVGGTYAEDPLVQRKMTVSLGVELLSAVERTVSGGAEVRIPMLMLHGEGDPIVPIEGSRRFFAGLAVPEKRLLTYPGLRHELFNEPERETVFQNVLDWVGGGTGNAPATPSGGPGVAG
jgi:alpha-beta hydrolase superfamily lysophospholipase